MPVLSECISSRILYFILPQNSDLGAALVLQVLDGSADILDGSRPVESSQEVSGALRNNQTEVLLEIVVEDDEIRIAAMPIAKSGMGGRIQPSRE